MYTHLQLDGRILIFVGRAIPNYFNTNDKLRSKPSPLGANVYKRVSKNTLIMFYGVMILMGVYVI